MTTEEIDSKDVEKAEEGTPTEDNKSDAGSATTAPSVESGDTNNKAAVEEASPNHGRRWILSGAALILIGGAITAAALLAPSNGKKTSVTSSSESTVSMGGDEEAPPMFTPTTFEAPFQTAELPLFGKEDLEPYESREALEADLTLVAQRMANKIILQNLELQFQFGNPEPADEGFGPQQNTNNNNNDALAEAAIPITPASAKQATQKKKAYGYTNNQEADADEADYIKTDGQYVYASYADYLVVWDLEGEMVTNAQMPAPEEPKRVESEDDMYAYEPVFENMNDAYVESIQLTDNHVVVVVGGTRNHETGQVGSGSGETHVRVYKKPTPEQATLELVGTKDIHGRFFESKYLESTNTIHIFTGGDLDAYFAMVEPLELYPGATAEQYYESASRKAADELIPAFVQKVIDFFEVDGQLPSILKINSWKNEHTPETETVFHKDYRNAVYLDESVQSYTQISSLVVDNIPAALAEAEPLELTTTAYLGPRSESPMYATDDSIVTHARRYDFNEATGHSDETLFLLQFKVDADTGAARLHTTHTTLGHLNDRKSIDITGNDLRIATTHQKWSPLDNVWPVCGDQWYIEDSCMTQENWNDCFDVAIACRNVKKVGCPYTFECEDGDDMGSSTDNFVSVFDISQAGEMQEIGSVRIGEPHEVIRGAHFERTYAYVNTFDERDPFYVIRLENGQAPVIAGQLKLDGFASYLQPISEDGSLVLGIGQNVTGEGLEQAPNGLLVTIYDVSNTAEPIALTSQMLTDPSDADSFSDAEWEGKSVQYNNGILVFPVILSGKYYHEGEGEWIENERGEWIESTSAPGNEDSEPENFDGFIVFDVSNVKEQGLKEVARIGRKNTRENMHRESGNSCSYCNGNHYKRSFLFDDMSLMTVYDGEVQRMDVTTGNTLWTMEISVEGRRCCY